MVMSKGTFFNECHLLLLFLIITVNLLHVSAEGPPRKIDISNDKKIIFAHYKRHLELKCPIDISDASEPIFFDWFRKDQSLYNEKGFTITTKGILKIKSVTKEHGGIYTCECVNGFGFVRVNITVIVDEPEVGNGTTNVASRISGNPPVIKRRPTTKFIHEINEHATFHCVASSQPTPHMFWLKNGQQIAESENETSYGRAHSILRLHNLKKWDAGVYKCIARNQFGEDEIDYTLHIAEPPRNTTEAEPQITEAKPQVEQTTPPSQNDHGNAPGNSCCGSWCSQAQTASKSEPSSSPEILSLEPANATIKQGSTAVFWCKVRSKSSLKLHIKWLKRLNIKEDGEPIDDVTLFRSGKTYYRPLNFSDGIGANGVHQSKLIIKNAVREDSGIYVCLALNDKGFNAMNGTLIVVGAAAEPSSAWSPYFSTRNTFFAAIVTIGVLIILTSVMIISHFCCRQNSSKGIISYDPTGKPDCENQIQASALIRQPDQKVPVLCPDIKTHQWKTKLLCGETHYNCEHSEHEVIRPVHMKSYP